MTAKVTIRNLDIAAKRLASVLTVTERRDLRRQQRQAVADVMNDRFESAPSLESGGPFGPSTSWKAATPKYIKQTLRSSTYAQGTLGERSGALRRSLTQGKDGAFTGGDALRGGNQYVITVGSRLAYAEYFNRDRPLFGDPEEFVQAAREATERFLSQI